MRAARATVLLAFCAGLAAASPAGAAPPRPADLSVIGGAGWHADNRFSLTWATPPAGDPPVVAVHYRLLSPLGAVIQEERLNRIEGLGTIAVPRVSGVYGAEVWFEDGAGQQGPAATASLRFDRTRPGRASPAPLPAWIGRPDLPLRVRLDHPEAPLPPAGIRGYAASLDTDPGGSPCRADDRCEETEITLHGGIGDDTLTIAAPPEGTSHLHVVAVSGAGMKSAESAEAVLRVDTVDPVTRLSGAPAGWANRSVRIEATASDEGSGMRVSDSGEPPLTAIRVAGGAPAVALGEKIATTVIDEGVHRVAYYARDAAGNVDDGTTANGVSNRPPRVAWVRIDRTPPHAAFSNSQDPADPDLIRVRIADALSGPDPARGWVGVRRAGSGDPYRRLPAAPPASGTLRARWSSDGAAIGAYEFAALAYDAAGNSTLVDSHADGSPMVLVNPLKATTVLRGAFPPDDRSRTVPYGRGVAVHGRLLAGLRTPLGDAPIRVVERFAPGAQPAIRTSVVRTGPDGRFALRASPGPSRTIELCYDGGPTLGRAVGPALHLGVRGRVRLGASSGSATVGGRPIVFGGRVVAPAGTIPGEGMPVQLQFRVGRSPWSAFRTVQADRRGRFRYAYRFSDDDSRGARFQFRAYLPAQEGWPYEPAGSRPVIVRGR